MNPTVRIILAAIAGVFAWGVLWNIGNAGAAALWPDLIVGAERIDAPGLLLAFAGFSIALSVGAGWLCARIGGAGARTAVIVLAAANLGIGAAVQTAYWDMMPLWYHLLFLGAVVPATLVGGRLHGYPGGDAHA